MIRRLIAIFRKPAPSALIAKRALRVSNRAPEAAAKYERIHAILAEGVRK